MAYKKVTGVYKILCVATGKPYIGSAVSIKARWSSHKHLLRNGKHGNKHLQNSWNKYGESSFQFTVVEVCAEDVRIVREQYWIDKFDAANPENGLNNAPTASTTVGYRHSPATLALLKTLAQDRPATHLHQHRFTKGTQTFLGKKHTEATLDVLRAKAKARGMPPMAGWNAGGPMPQELKDKIALKVASLKVVYGEVHVAQAKELRNQGLSYPKIAKAMNISTATAHRLVTESRLIDRAAGMRSVEKVKGVATR